MSEPTPNGQPTKALVINCGSSSIKYRLYEMPERRLIMRGAVDRIGSADSTHEFSRNADEHSETVTAPNHRAAIEAILSALVGKDGVLKSVDEIGVVGHRVVHGGEDFTGSVLIDEKVEAAIQRYSDLAPLHNPSNLMGIRVSKGVLSGIPHTASFDTAFHSRIPRRAYMYALPYELYSEFGIRKYGFHGTSHRYVARRAAQLLGRHKYDIDCVTCHLGNGCSIAAVEDGYSIDTSMGLTPLEGLVMGTRSGDLDPAILFFLARKGYSIDRLSDLLNKESGLLGLSGTSNDLRTLEEAAGNGDARAQLAIEIFTYRLRKYIGAYMALLHRVDAIVFTGGIGENSPLVREMACSSLGALGVELDPERNRTLEGEGEIGTDDSPVRLFVIPTDEEAAIASDAYDIAYGYESPSM
jgi:acetate kinase